MKCYENLTVQPRGRARVAHFRLRPIVVKGKKSYLESVIEPANAIENATGRGY